MVDDMEVFLSETLDEFLERHGITLTPEEERVRADVLCGPRAVVLLCMISERAASLPIKKAMADIVIAAVQRDAAAQAAALDGLRALVGPVFKEWAS